MVFIIYQFHYKLCNNAECKLFILIDVNLFMFYFCKYILYFLFVENRIVSTCSSNKNMKRNNASIIYYGWSTSNNIRVFTVCSNMDSNKIFWFAAISAGRSLEGQHIFMLGFRDAWNVFGCVLYNLSVPTCGFENNYCYFRIVFWFLLMILWRPFSMLL